MIRHPAFVFCAAGLVVGMGAVRAARAQSLDGTWEITAVIDDGRVVQSGSHTALLAEGGLYADLYETQFSRTA